MLAELSRADHKAAVQVRRYSGEAGRPPRFLFQQSAAHLLAHGERSGHQSIFRTRSLLTAIG